MAKSGRPKKALELTAEKRADLERYERGRTTAQALALGARIVLLLLQTHEGIDDETPAFLRRLDDSAGGELIGIEQGDDSSSLTFTSASLMTKGWSSDSFVRLLRVGRG